MAPFNDASIAWKLLKLKPKTKKFLKSQGISVVEDLLDFDEWQIEQWAQPKEQEQQQQQQPTISMILPIECNRLKQFQKWILHLLEESKNQSISNRHSNLPIRLPHDWSSGFSLDALRWSRHGVHSNNNNNNNNNISISQYDHTNPDPLVGTMLTIPTTKRKGNRKEDKDDTKDHDGSISVLTTERNHLGGRPRGRPPGRRNMKPSVIPTPPITTVVYCCLRPTNEKEPSIRTPFLSISISVQSSFLDLYDQLMRDFEKSSSSSNNNNNNNNNNKFNTYQQFFIHQHPQTILLHPTSERIEWDKDHLTGPSKLTFLDHLVDECLDAKCPYVIFGIKSREAEPTTRWESTRKAPSSATSNSMDSSSTSGSSSGSSTTSGSNPKNRHAKPRWQNVMDDSSHRMIMTSTIANSTKAVLLQQEDDEGEGCNDKKEEKFPVLLYNRIIQSYDDAKAVIPSNLVHELHQLTMAILKILVCLHGRVPIKSLPTSFQYHPQEYTQDPTWFDGNSSFNEWSQVKLKQSLDGLFQAITVCPFLLTDDWRGYKADIIRLEELVSKKIDDLANHAKRQKVLRRQHKEKHQQLEQAPNGHLEVRLTEKRLIQPIQQNKKVHPRYQPLAQIMDKLDFYEPTLVTSKDIDGWVGGDGRETTGKSRPRQGLSQGTTSAASLPSSPMSGRKQGATSKGRSTSAADATLESPDDDMIRTRKLNLIRARRVKFWKELQLSFLVATFKFIPGGRHPHVFILYKVPLNPDDRNNQREMQAHERCLSELRKMTQKLK